MKYKLKLVRPDVATDDMFSMSESTLISPPTISRKTKRNLKNAVQVKFNERWTGKTPADVADDSVDDCTPIDTNGYWKSSSAGYQVYPPDYYGVDGIDTPPGAEGNGYTITMRLTVDASMYSYVNHDSDQIAFVIGSRSSGAEDILFSSGKSGSFDSDDPRQILLQEDIKCWDINNPDDPCEEEWLNGQALRTTTMSQNYYLGATLYFTFHIDRIDFSINIPFSMVGGNAFSPNWVEFGGCDARHHTLWPGGTSNPAIILPSGYNLYVGGAV